MLSLPGFPFPKGGSRGARPEVCAIAPAVNAEAIATAKTNFFTIFSVVFRGDLSWRGTGNGWTQRFLSPFKTGGAVYFVALCCHRFRSGSCCWPKKNPPAFWGRRIVRVVRCG